MTATDCVRRVVPTVAAVVLVGLGACGGKPDPSPGQSLAQTSSPKPVALRVSCESSWWPKVTTFANRRWRSQSVFAGPVTFLNAKRLATVRSAGGLSIKIRTLVRPNTPVTIVIERAARTTAGFVPMNNAGEAGFAESTPVLRLDGCPGVPRGEQAIRGLAHIGFPVFVATKRRRCVGLEVTPEGRSTVRVAVSLGVRTCPHD